MVIPAAA
ncbi:hypothetical protein YPPY94_3507, partial [Yersinia pestis PY-94]